MEPITNHSMGIPGQKILIVDDLSENLVMLKKIIHPMGVDVISVESGEAALEAVLQHTFAVIILDVMMPGMDGYTLAGRFKEIPSTRGVPLIFITALDMLDDDVLEGYDLGAIDYIFKPFVPKVLISKLKVLLEIDRKIRALERQREELKKREADQLRELEIRQSSLNQSRLVTLKMMDEATQAKLLAEENAERYRMLFQNMPNGFALHEMIYDEQGIAVDYRFLRVNPAFETLTGLKRRALIGKTVKEVLPDTEQHWIDLYAEVVETGKPLFFENYAQELGKYFSVRAYRPEAGRFAVLFSDITESRRNAEKLKLTQFAVDNLQDGAYWINLAGAFTYVNERACKELGYTEEELLRLSIWDVDPEMTAEIWHRVVPEIRADGETIFERMNKRKDGSVFPVEVKVNYLEFDGRSFLCGFAHNITDRKASREKLISSQRLLRSIIDTIPVQVFWKDRDSGYLGCNSAFAREVGLERPQEIIGKTDAELPLQALHAENYISDDQAVMKSGTPKLGFTEEVSRPGKPGRWVKTNKVPLTDQTGKIIGILGTVEDITESKQMQAAIEKQIVALTRPVEDAGEITFDELFNIQDIQRIQDEFAAATHVASIITQPDGIPITRPSNYTDLCKIIRGTEMGCAHCMRSEAKIGKGGPSGPVIQPCLSGGLWDAGARITVGGKHIASWLIGQVRDESQTDQDMLAYARKIGADEKKFLDAFHRVPGMTKKHFQHVANALYTLANQLSTSAYQNIQQARFIADEERRTKELRRLSTAIEQSPEVIVITDMNGVIEYVNPAFERSTGYSCSEAVGQTPSLLKSNEHSEEFYREMWRTISSGETWNGHIVNRRKDGTLYTEEAVISPVKTPEGMITNFVAVKNDITQELVQEEKMQKAQQMEAVGQLAGGIAHDFNNILQTIMGFSDLLLFSLDDSNAEPRENVEEIQKAARHAAELTRELLAFSRKQHVEFSAMNVNDTILKTLSFLNSIIGENIRVLTDLVPEVYYINADSSQLERAILNMSLNARDAMPRGGVLTIRTEKVKIPGEKIPVTPVSQSGYYICLSICDTGTGIPPEVVDHIFEPFFSTKPTGSGTGLGLAASYGIIRKHDGWIDVYSKPGEGTEFKIYLPVLMKNPDSSESFPVTAEALPPKGKGQRILIVEDSDSVRMLSETILKDAGYSVVCADSAENAEVLFENENGKFDLLFSDVILTGKNGADLAVTLQEKNPELRVILCSGYSGNRIEQTGANLKDYVFLEKPFTLSKLLHQVFEVLKDL